MRFCGPTPAALPVSRCSGSPEHGRPHRLPCPSLSSSCPPSPLLLSMHPSCHSFVPFAPGPPLLTPKYGGHGAGVCTRGLLCHFLSNVDLIVSEMFILSTGVSDTSSPPCPQLPPPLPPHAMCPPSCALCQGSSAPSHLLGLCGPPCSHSQLLRQSRQLATLYQLCPLPGSTSSLVLMRETPAAPITLPVFSQLRTCSLPAAEISHHLLA